MLTSELKGGAYIKDAGGAMSRDITEVETLVTAAGARAPDRRGPVDLQSQQSTLNRLGHAEGKIDPQARAGARQILLRPRRCLPRREGHRRNKHGAVIDEEGKLHDLLPGQRAERNLLGDWHRDHEFRRRRVTVVANLFGDWIAADRVVSADREPLRRQQPIAGDLACRAQDEITVIKNSGQPWQGLNERERQGLVS